MEINDTARYADMFAALGAEPRLRIVRLLLAAHPEGMTVGDIQSELEIPGSTLSHHLEKLRMEGLVIFRKREAMVMVFGQCGSLAGPARIPVRRVLHALAGGRAGQDHICEGKEIIQ